MTDNILDNLKFIQTGTTYKEYDYGVVAKTLLNFDKAPNYEDFGTYYRGYASLEFQCHVDVARKEDYQDINSRLGKYFLEVIYGDVKKDIRHIDYLLYKNGIRCDEVSNKIRNILLKLEGDM